jgi:DNA-binding beta-propeller fold protein YncE
MEFGGLSPEAHNDPGCLYTPRGASVNDEGEIFVADSENFRVEVFSPDGTYITDWGSMGYYDPGYFIWPSDTAIDAEGNVYVADAHNNRIQKFTDEGDFIIEFGTSGGETYLGDTFSVTIDKINNLVYATTNLGNRIVKFDTDGNFIKNWGVPGEEIEEFSSPHGIAVDNNGDVYVADTNNNRIQKFTAEGVFITQFGSKGTRDGEFLHPKGIAVDNKGLVFVADSENHRIQVFSQGHPHPDQITGLTANGSFEYGTYIDDWTYGGMLSVSRSSFSTDGTYGIELGQPVEKTEQGKGLAFAYSTFYVPLDWDRPVLTFDYEMITNDIIHYSDFFVAVQDGAGLNHLKTVIRDGYQPCIPNLAPPAATNLGWRSVRVDLSEFKGQNIRLVFYNRNLWPISWGIWTYVDNVKVLDAGPLPPYSSYIPLISSNYCDLIEERSSFTSIYR